MSVQFKIFLSQLSETNATLDYFTDFKKIKGNVSKIAIKLNQLNYLIGRSDIEAAVKELYEENPKSFEVLDILIAIVSIRSATYCKSKKNPQAGIARLGGWNFLSCSGISWN